jgi:uncharacterized damage-inducible protein DinB
MLSKKDAIAAGGFLTYIAKAPDKKVTTSIGSNTKAFKKFLKKIPAKKHHYAYAEGKWTIAELLLHMIDAERVFAYRALRLARLDATPMPGFDENQWAASANQTRRRWKNLEEEFFAVRQSTELLFEQLSEKELLFTGTASNHPVNALAMGYVIAGHVQHHMDIIKERYLKA